MFDKTINQTTNSTKLVLICFIPNFKNSSRMQKENISYMIYVKKASKDTMNIKTIQ